MIFFLAPSTTFPHEKVPFLCRFFFLKKKFDKLGSFAGKPKLGNAKAKKYCEEEEGRQEGNEGSKLTTFLAAQGK